VQDRHKLQQILSPNPDDEGEYGFNKTLGSFGKASKRQYYKLAQTKEGNGVFMLCVFDS
jgi:hypothetical protein